MEWAQNNNIRYKEIQFVPSAVTGLTASSYGKNATYLKWNHSAYAEGYLIYGQKNGKYGYVGMTSENFLVDGEALDTDYNFYWVFPYVTNGSDKMIPGGCTKYVWAKGVCPAVTNLRASSVSGGVKLTWTASQTCRGRNAAGYLIYGKTATGKYGYIGMTAGTSFKHAKASKSEYNFYWVFPYHKNASGKMIVGGTPHYVYGKAK